MIIFRQTKGDIPNDWLADVHWQVEYYSDTHEASHPLGVAYVSYFRGVSEDAVVDSVLDFIIVDDRYRRQGIATALIDACCSRWPEIILTSGVTDAGEALIASINRARDKDNGMKHATAIIICAVVAMGFAPGGPVPVPCISIGAAASAGGTVIGGAPQAPGTEVMIHPTLSLPPGDALTFCASLEGGSVSVVFPDGTIVQAVASAPMIEAGGATVVLSVPYIVDPADAGPGGYAQFFVDWGLTVRVDQACPTFVQLPNEGPCSAGGAEVGLPVAIAGAEVTCGADVDLDGFVGITDLAEIITRYGDVWPRWDTTGEGVIDIEDVITVITMWGACG